MRPQARAHPAAGPLRMTSIPLARFPRYAPTLVALHWLTLLLMIAVYALMELRGIYPRGSAERAAMASWHFTLGLTVLAVTTLRLAVRLTTGRPPIVPPPPAWQEKAALAVEVLLYGLLIGLPMLGWLTVNARDVPASFWGLAVPQLLAPDKVLGAALKQVHETLATAGYFLIGLHAAAALFHHHVLRDNTLARMGFGPRT